MRSLIRILLLLLALPAFADVVAGQRYILFLDRWAPAGGGPVFPLGVPARSAAFDGERFLTGWRDGDVVWLALFDEGATIPFTRTSIDVAGSAPPIVRWSGTQFVVVCDGPVPHIALVSRQGIVETLKELPGTRSIVDAAAGASGIALLSHYSTATHSGVLDVLLLDDSLRVATRTTIGSIRKSSGYGTTYLASPRIAGFGTGFYALWREGRSARYDIIVGTRVLLDGTAPEVMPALREPDSLSGTFLDERAPVPLDIALHEYGLRLAVQPIRQWGNWTTTTLVDRAGVPAQSDVVFKTGKVIVPLIGTVKFDDGSIAGVYVDKGVAVVTPILGAPKVRRRSSPH
jgi:hypothetical protein